MLGRPLELKIEDNQSTNPGSVLATSKLLGGGDIVAMLGPIRSTQLQAVAPTINKAGIPTMIGGSDFGLTHSNNKWYFRVRPHDGYSAKVIADFAANTLQREKWAIATGARGTLQRPAGRAGRRTPGRHSARASGPAGRPATAGTSS